MTPAPRAAGGAERMEFFRRVVDWPSLKATGAKLSFQGFVTGELWIALVTFLYIDFLDTTGTLFSMASFINNYIPGARAAPAGAEPAAPCCDGVIPCGRLVVPECWLVETCGQGVGLGGVAGHMRPSLSGARAAGPRTRACDGSERAAAGTAAQAP